MKDAFVSAVNHEMRTPLTAVGGALDLIRGGAAGEISPKIAGLLLIADRNVKRLTQVLGNLVDNAMKFALDQTPVKLELKEQKEAGMLHFAVINKGSPIAQEEQERIFENFISLNARTGRG